MNNNCAKPSWLALAGGGLHPGHFTQDLIALAKCAHTILVDTYTMPGSSWLYEELRNLAGAKVRLAKRSDLETNAAKIASEALERRILVAVPGDPLIATTHRALLEEAKRVGAQTILVPGISGVCAAKTVVGLDYYKYGRIVTLPGPWRMVKPYSVLEYIYGNLCLGLHTLALLDIDPSTGRQLDPCRGLQGLHALEQELGSGLLRKASKILVERAQLPGENVSRLICPRDKPLGEPASIIIPGRLARYEAEALSILHRIGDADNASLQKEACKLLDEIADL